MANYDVHLRLLIYLYCHVHSCSLSLQENTPCQHPAIYGVDVPAPDHHSDTVVWWLHIVQTSTCDGNSIWDVPVDWHCQTVCSGGWVSHSYNTIVFILVNLNVTHNIDLNYLKHECTLPVVIFASLYHNHPSVITADPYPVGDHFSQYALYIVHC